MLNYGAGKTRQMKWKSWGYHDQYLTECVTEGEAGRGGGGGGGIFKKIQGNVVYEWSLMM